MNSKGQIQIIIFIFILLIAFLGFGYIAGYRFFSKSFFKGVVSKSAQIPDSAEASPTASDNNLPTPYLSCNNDQECLLVIRGSWSNCALGNDCQPADYSLTKWIAVNSGWYTSLRSSYCPPDKFQPVGCNPKPINDQFQAKCVNQVCQKIPLGKSI